MHYKLEEAVEAVAGGAFTGMHARTEEEDGFVEESMCTRGAPVGEQPRQPLFPLFTYALGREKCHEFVVCVCVYVGGGREE